MRPHALIEMLLFLFSITVREVVGRGLTIEPASFTTHEYTPQVHTWFRRTLKNGTCWPSFMTPLSFISWMLILHLQPSVTLYPNSVVVNLNDANTSSLYNSHTLWLVQFYSHWSIINLIFDWTKKTQQLLYQWQHSAWKRFFNRRFCIIWDRCGHCQRFAPFWQALAEDIKGQPNDWHPE